MAEMVKEKARNVHRAKAQIIGFRRPLLLAKVVKVEAAQRQFPLNRLVTQMRELDRQHKRAG
jgi:hypothetical protein